jgi:nitrate/TMAO reductase-like tetraheme cytochrome c subunit
MRYLFVLVSLLCSFAFGGEAVKVEEKFQNSQKCKACHMPIVQDWEKSWHAKSHYNNDEYFKESINYVQRKTRKSLDSVKIYCASCHNPRISITSTDLNYEIADAMGLSDNSKIKKALADDVLNEGINCIVCHNIDKIHDDKDKTKRGIHRIEWMPSGVMSGPYDDAKSPYHKVEYRDFMDKKSDKLCFVCHANDSSVSGIMFINMQEEYKQTDKKCVDCHMGEAQIGLASTFKIAGESKEREVRKHTFYGGHKKEILRDSLEIESIKKGKDIYVSINNPNPHNIPSGFGSREVIVELNYKKGIKIIEKQNISITSKYTRRNGKPTIPHLAQKIVKNDFIPAHGNKTFKIKRIGSATSLEVKLFYRLVNDEVMGILKLKDKIWSEKSYIASKEIQLGD